MNELKKIINNQGADHYIHFCGYQHDLTRVYETAQAEILTSQYEGFAMALGFSVVRNGLPATPESIGKLRKDNRDCHESAAEDFPTREDLV